MKNIKKALAFILAAAMVFALTACTKGEDVTGKYLCVGESYGDTNYGEPYEESWVELNKGGKGTYHSGFDFKMKWKLDGETFTSTVTFLGMEEAMDGTLKNGVLEVKYGDMYIKFVKEGVEAPETPAEPEGNGSEGETGGNVGASGVNDGVIVAANFADAFAGTVTGTESGTEGDVGVEATSAIINPSTWYGWMYTAYTDINADAELIDAWGFVDTASKPYFEVFKDGDSQHPFLSMYMTLENDATAIVPDIGSEDAWIGECWLDESDVDEYTFYLLEDGSLVGSMTYIDPNGEFTCEISMFFREDGVLWDEDGDMLPPRYEEYKAELIKNNPDIAGTSEPAAPAAAGSGDYGKSVPEADGIVDFDTLKTAFKWTREQTSYENGYGKDLTYEKVMEKMGTHGKKTHDDNWRDDYHVYEWVSTGDDFLLMTFKVDASGNENWNSSSWSSSLND